MAVVTASPEVAVPRRRLLRRPTATHGFWGWINTVDHKKIGILYGVTGFSFFLVGGVEALLIRVQLARPDGKILTANAEFATGPRPTANMWWAQTPHPMRPMARPENTTTG